MILATDELVEKIAEVVLEYATGENQAGSLDKSPGERTCLVPPLELQEELAYVFHAVLARQAVASCLRVREETGDNVVALSGGVFQNTLLLDEVKKGLEQQDFQVLKHTLVPPNDGGIALGQAVYAMNRLNKED